MRKFIPFLNGSLWKIVLARFSGPTARQPDLTYPKAPTTATTCTETSLTAPSLPSPTADPANLGDLLPPKVIINRSNASLIVFVATLLQYVHTTSTNVVYYLFLAHCFQSILPCSDETFELSPLTSDMAQNFFSTRLDDFDYSDDSLDLGSQTQVPSGVTVEEMYVVKRVNFSNFAMEHELNIPDDDEGKSCGFRDPAL